MGMFDTVRAACPKCNVAEEIQTKAGPCTLRKFTVPRWALRQMCAEAASAVIDVAEQGPFTCKGCGAKFDIEVTSAARTTLAKED